MKIRKAQPKDTKGILALLLQVNNVHSEGRPDLFLKDKTKYTEEELQEILADTTRPIFVAVDENDKVLGYAFGVFQSHIEDNNWPDITTFYVDDICVDEACRGQHIGKALYEFVKVYAKEQGCYNLTLNVWAKNASAQRFYESCGLQIQKYGMEEIL